MSNSDKEYCRFCRISCSPSMREMHELYCKKNPKNITEILTAQKDTNVKTE